MPNNQLPKAVLYGELSVGKRKTGGQKLRYKDVLKRKNDYTRAHERPNSTVSYLNYNYPRCQRPYQSKAGLMAHMCSCITP